MYRRGPIDCWRSTYQSHLTCFARYSWHDVYYLNAARKTAPHYLQGIDFDAVIFHYTFLAQRVNPEEFEASLAAVEFLRSTACPKALIPHDEQVHADYLCQVVRDYGVTHVFTPASESEWPKIYRGIDLSSLTFKTVLTGYIDDRSVAATAARARIPHDRPIDIGYRSWDTYPHYGRHGLLKGEVGRLFKVRAHGAGLVADISSDPKDAFYGDSWFDFLLRCRYTIGVEGGTSILDFDGNIAECTRTYMAKHPSAPFGEIEAACFPRMDGRFHYHLLGPRHLEAVMTRTCQVLIEGEYGGVLEAGRHYIALKRDFSNIDEVLEAMKDEQMRLEMVDRAYADVIESGRWTYESFAQEVLQSLVPRTHEPGKRSHFLMRLHVLLNRLDSVVWMTGARLSLACIRAVHATKNTLRPVAATILGEERLSRILRRLRGQGSG